MKKKTEQLAEKSIWVLLFGFLPIFRIKRHLMSDSIKSTWWLLGVVPLFSTEKFFVEPKDL